MNTIFGKVDILTSYTYITTGVTLSTDASGINDYWLYTLRLDAYELPVPMNLRLDCKVFLINVSAA